MRFRSRHCLQQGCNGLLFTVGGRGWPHGTIFYDMAKHATEEDFNEWKNSLSEKEQREFAWWVHRRKKPHKFPDPNQSHMRL